MQYLAIRRPGSIENVHISTENQVYETNWKSMTLKEFLGLV